jgi:hypothetical protein
MQIISHCPHKRNPVNIRRRLGTLRKETLIHGLLSDVLEMVCAFPQRADHTGFHSARFPVGPKEEPLALY